MSARSPSSPDPPAAPASTRDADHLDDLAPGLWLRLRWLPPALVLLLAGLLGWRWAMGTADGRGQWLVLGAALVLALFTWHAIGSLTRAHRRLQAREGAAQQELSRLRGSVDALPVGVEVYDEADHLVLCNEVLVQMYPHLGAALREGDRFETLLRRSMAMGMIVEAIGCEEAWLARRLAERGQRSEPLLHQLADGRWVELQERRTASGSVVAVRMDVTERVQQQQAVAAAQREAEEARTLLEDAIEGLSDGFAYFDVDDRLVLCNQRYREVYHGSAAAMRPGTSFEAILRYGLARGQYPEAVGQESDWLSERMHRHRHPGPAVVQAQADGRWLRIEERQTRTGGTVGLRTDVTELVRRGQQLAALNRQLSASSAQLQAIISTARSVILTVDQAGQVLFANRAATERLGWSVDDLVGQPVERVIGEALHGRGAAGPPAATRSPRDVRARHRDGRLVAMQLEVSSYHAGEVRHHVCMLTDVSEREASAQALREANARLEALSETDALTGLANRRQLDRRLREEWLRAQRHVLPLALLMVDVDHFKRYNDRHGHQAGDRCLHQIAQALTACAGRTADLVARYGGEEFVLLLPHADADEAGRVARRCAVAMSELALPHGDSPVHAQVTLSIGLAVARPGREVDAMADPATLLHAADEALYQAKQAGRNRTAVALAGPG